MTLGHQFRRLSTTARNFVQYRERIEAEIGHEETGSRC